MLELTARVPAAGGAVTAEAVGYLMLMQAGLRRCRLRRPDLRADKAAVIADRLDLPVIAVKVT
jgi:hypothetical protein